jgi:hypothetical protein
MIENRRKRRIADIGHLSPSTAQKMLVGSFVTSCWLPFLSSVLRATTAFSQTPNGVAESFRHREYFTI